MTPELIVTLAIPILYATLWLVEARHPARAFAHVPAWRCIGLVFFVVVSIVGTLTPLALERLGGMSTRLVDLRALGFFGLPLGLLATSFVGYWWHRAEHRFDLLWRASHQLHHSAERVDVPGAFFSHPLEVVAKTSIAFVVGNVALGLAPSVAATSAGILTLLSIFPHWNGHTPTWLGYIVPRPEMHALHHEAGVHGRNYGDLPIWDLAFDTHVNPPHFDGQVGLGAGASRRIGAMLAMRDVSAPAER